MQELFIDDLDSVHGGRVFQPKRPCQCCMPTTLACGEEANGCSGCGPDYATS